MAITSNKQLKQYYSDKLQKLDLNAAVRCIHFGECGGCSWQNLEYAKQVELKRDALTEIMREITSEAIELIGSPAQYDYRARMDYVCSHDPFHPPLDRLGLRKRKQFNHVIDLQECHLIPQGMFGKVRKVYAKAMKLEIPLYDLVSSKGDLRYLVTRTNGTDQMLIIITKTEEFADKVRELMDYAMSIDFVSVYWTLQPSVTDVSFGEIHEFKGEESLIMVVGDRNPVQLKISPNNFFQNNIPQFNQLLNYVETKLVTGNQLIDLYCGVGTIGLSLADKFTDVLGVELEQVNVDMAKQNAELNNVKNIQFFAGDVAKLKAQVDLSAKQDKTTVIVDPPRAGLTPKGVEEVLALMPEQLIYISCNPITQAQDLVLLQEKYRLEEIRGFDMFPQTPHMESVAIMSKI